MAGPETLISEKETQRSSHQGETPPETARAGGFIELSFTRIMRGYHREAHTHTQASVAFAQGAASTGVGLQADAQQFYLGFIPLFQECYDLVIPQESLDDPRISLLIECFLSEEYRRLIEGQEGYDTTKNGKERRNLS